MCEEEIKHMKEEVAKAGTGFFLWWTGKVSLLKGHLSSDRKELRR